MIQSAGLKIVSRMVSNARRGIDFEFTYDEKVGKGHIAEAAIERLGHLHPQLKSMEDIFDAEATKILNVAYLHIQVPAQRESDGTAFIGAESIG